MKWKQRAANHDRILYQNKYIKFSTYNLIYPDIITTKTKQPITDEQIVSYIPYLHLLILWWWVSASIRNKDSKYDALLLVSGSEYDGLKRNANGCHFLAWWHDRCSKLGDMYYVACGFKSNSMLVPWGNYRSLVCKYGINSSVQDATRSFGINYAGNCGT